MSWGRAHFCSTSLGLDFPGPRQVELTNLQMPPCSRIYDFINTEWQAKFEKWTQRQSHSLGGKSWSFPINIYYKANQIPSQRSDRQTDSKGQIIDDNKHEEFRSKGLKFSRWLGQSPEGGDWRDDSVGKSTDRVSGRGGSSSQHSHGWLLTTACNSSLRNQMPFDFWELLNAHGAQTCTQGYICMHKKIN